MTDGKERARMGNEQLLQKSDLAVCLSIRSEAQLSRRWTLTSEFDPGKNGEDVLQVLHLHRKYVILSEFN
jgi:hypothetical protein